MRMPPYTALLLLALSFSSRAQAVAVEDETKIFDSYALEQQGDNQGAIKKMTSVLAKNKNNYFINLRLGWLFSQVKKYKNAIEHYEAAAKISPASIEPLLGLSLVQYNLGDYLSAAKVSEKLLERDPKNYVAHTRLVAAKIKLNEYTAALSLIDQAAKYYPTDPLLLEQKGLSLMQLGRVAEAKRTLNDLMLVSPTNAYAQSVLGGVGDNN